MAEHDGTPGREDPPGTSRNGHSTMQLTPEQLQDFEDHEFLRYYIHLPDMHDADEPPAYHRLFHPHWMRHVKDILERRPDLIQGRLAPWANTQRGLGLWWPDLEKAIRATPTHEVVELPYVPETLMPELPSEAYIDPAVGAHAGQWLDNYITYSKQWATSSADAFHEATGLWVLSTIAARRLRVEMGKRIYPGLFLAMVAPSGMYFKSTAAEIGRGVIERIGCEYLLAPERPTPQRLLHIMSGVVPENFGALDEIAQEIERYRLMFAAQRGWYYDDWGGLLDQLVRRDSPMSMFHELFRVLDDGQEQFTTATMTRGEETIRGAYVAFLASATPDDLAPFMKSRGKWWSDGFWPRFAFAVPGIDEAPKANPRPDGLPPEDHWVISTLMAWKTSLGLPQCSIVERFDPDGKKLPGWRRILNEFPCKVMAYTPETKAAHDAYVLALRNLGNTDGFNRDLRSCYIRMPERALRIAMLLASIDHCDCIELGHWAYAQRLVERQRAMLHRVILMAEDSQPQTREQILEEKTVRALADGSSMTLRDMMRAFHTSSDVMTKIVTALMKANILEVFPSGRTQVYRLMVEKEGTNTEEEEYQSDTAESF